EFFAVCLLASGEVNRFGSRIAASKNDDADIADIIFLESLVIDGILMLPLAPLVIVNLADALHFLSVPRHNELPGLRVCSRRRPTRCLKDRSKLFITNFSAFVNSDAASFLDDAHQFLKGVVYRCMLSSCCLGWVRHGASDLGSGTA